MPQLNEFCSRCGNNWMGCDCSNYHPPIRLPEYLTVVHKESLDRFTISREEAENLYEYFKPQFIHERKFELVIQMTARLKEFIGFRTPSYDKNRRGNK